jgi:hypothetical protein
MSQLGRPHKPADRRRTEVLRCRVTAREADHVRRFAIRHNVNTSDVVRAAIALLFERQGRSR